MNYTKEDLERWASGDFENFNYRTSEVMTLIQNLSKQVLDLQKPEKSIKNNTFIDNVIIKFPDAQEEYGIPDIVKVLTGGVKPSFTYFDYTACPPFSAEMTLTRNLDRKIHIFANERQEIAGYAILWGEQFGGSVIEKGALSDQTLGNFQMNSLIRKGDYDHGIGKILKFVVTDFGLYVYSEITDAGVWSEILKFKGVKLGFEGVLKDFYYKTAPLDETVYVTGCDLCFITLEI